MSRSAPALVSICNRHFLIVDMVIRTQSHKVREILEYFVALAGL
jgi:hypothetical protein